MKPPKAKRRADEGDLKIEALQSHSSQETREEEKREGRENHDGPG
jgi:hypothetical protein